MATLVEERFTWLRSFDFSVVRPPRSGDEWRDVRTVLPDDWDPKNPPEWKARMPHERVEHDGYMVPIYEGDVERIEWERTHARA